MSRPTSQWLLLGALFGALGVILGAFGAHLLEERWQLSAERLATWETAVQYHLVHAVALLVVGVLAIRESSVWLRLAGWSYTLGILIFSGLLYVLTLSGIRILGAIVPIGGTLMIVGWICLAVAALRLPRVPT